ncbi:hypothetical protein FGB62_43g121 [Gracilaria domingensis]|nr:hypothetical protein FGB62_43g121 [Gracilaria domingensis]
MKSFDDSARSLVSSVNVEQNGTIKIDTSSGAHLTAEVVLEALKERDRRRKDSKTTTPKSAGKGRGIRKSFEETAGELRRLIRLAPEREIRRNALNTSRRHRRAVRAMKAAFAVRNSGFQVGNVL